MNTHLHVTAWALAFILFIIVVILHKTGKAKGAKIVQMILRLDYLLILYSGGSLLANYFGGSSMMGEAIFKGLAGIWAIFAMEMISLKSGREEPTKSWWIQLVIAVLLTMILGFGRLPGGFA
ncbi:YisL family protein [Lentibacillus sp. Marseille-P4043]|uniref:YisL family protein n=1 Tax=Lentibacillus sp. Marseille-P4043 TaxID=2040293 RepID=UPI000D0AE467|nr:YisL family protein [Lentibacillus sp. Marseille-P4043]